MRVRRSDFDTSNRGSEEGCERRFEISVVRLSVSIGFPGLRSAADTIAIE